MARYTGSQTEKFYTPAEAQERLHVSNETLLRWAKKGRFGPGGVIRTLGNHRRYKASAVDAIARGSAR